MNVNESGISAIGSEQLSQNAILTSNTATIGEHDDTLGLHHTRITVLENGGGGGGGALKELKASKAFKVFRD